MTTAAELMADLQAPGVTLAADGDRLRFHPRDAVTPELLARLRDCKAELLAMLRTHGADGPQDDRGDALQAHGADAAGPAAAGSDPGDDGPSGTDRPAGQALPGDWQECITPDGRLGCLQPQAVAPVRTWPPLVPSGIIADPVIICPGCGRLQVVPGQPGRPSGLCFGCWILSQKRS